MTDVVLGNVHVTIGEGLDGGLTPEQMANVAVRKIISVADTAHPSIREQAKAFSRNIEAVVAHYMKQSIQAERKRITSALRASGQDATADLIERL
jgi:hypothetical protein